MNRNTYLAVGAMMQAAAHSQGVVGPVEFKVCQPRDYEQCSTEKFMENELFENDNEFEVEISPQSVRLLDALAERGIYGRTRSDVAGRFIDEALKRFVEPVILSNIGKRNAFSRFQ